MRACRGDCAARRASRPCSWRARLLGAGSICTSSRDITRTTRATFSAMAGRRGRRWREPWRAGNCGLTSSFIPARWTGNRRALSVPDYRKRYLARTAALQHLLLPLPRLYRQRARPDRAARISAAAVVSHRPFAASAGGALLRCDVQWLRRDVQLCIADFSGRSLADCGLHSRAAIGEHAKIEDVPDAERPKLEEKQP